ncbi:hypothetical protein Patl1_08741 [Pistacia atlantica]|uniref:Uncharacterized protein n=1 Tax=Pistacia atlantica TaxID=434234 RepID=A0ACC1AGV5_9ROSI|nr:hypothetical protein Patl1_08741 [Pistacia atlantica]
MSLASSSLCLFLFLSIFSCIKSDELQVLLTLKTALQGSNTDVLASWVSNNHVCDFTGITCNSDNFVKEIELSNQQLTGTLLFDSICQLQSLDKLSFGFNSLYGTISKELNNCTKLQYLDLGNNGFSGSFPSISSLSELRYLYLNNSGCSGVFPWASLEKMTNLISLSLGDHNFSPTPFPVEVLKLTKLNWLYLSNCSLQGPIPAEIGNLGGLISLELSANNLTGEIPTDIGKLNKLWQLELYQNRLTGQLPVGLRNLTNLQLFDVSTNFLEGNLSEVRFLTKLVSLQLFENQLSGEVPAELGQFKKLVNLSLYSNQLTGPLPKELGSWADFDFIDVSENFLTGPIPPDMCKKGTMKGLLMLQNKFTGEIPASYANCLTLERFRVSKNSLTGTVPAGIWGLPNLNIIDIELNQIEGPITKDIGNAKALAQLYAANNRLSGELPEEISEASSFVTIDLSNNQFSGKFPASIGDLKHLSTLKLQNNMFSGSIPNQTIIFFKRCSQKSKISKDVLTLIICFALGTVILLVSFACFFYLKKREKDHDPSLKEESWNMKPFRELVASEDEIIDSIKQENLIGKGGSGNVYKVMLSSGKELAVKHIWNSDTNGLKRARSTTPILGKRGGKSQEFEAEVQTLSSIRHVNVVKLNFNSKKRVLSLVDSRIPEVFKEDAVEILRIAVLCTARQPVKRPTMRIVVQMLEEADPCKLVRIVISKDGTAKKIEVKENEKINSSA